MVTTAESNSKQQQIERLEIVENSSSSSISNIVSSGGGAQQQSGQQQPGQRLASGQQIRYMDLLPPDGSFPHRTQPVGEPGGAARQELLYNMGYAPTYVVIILLSIGLMTF